MVEMLKLSEKAYGKLKVNDVNLAWSLLCESLLKDNVNLDFENLVAIKKLDANSSLKPGSVLTREKDGEEKFIFQQGSIGRFSKDEMVNISEKEICRANLFYAARDSKATKKIFGKKKPVIQKTVKINTGHLTGYSTSLPDQINLKYTDCISTKEYIYLCSQVIFTNKFEISSEFSTKVEELEASSGSQSAGNDQDEIIELDGEDCFDSLIQKNNQTEVFSHSGEIFPIACILKQYKKKENKLVATNFDRKKFIETNWK